MQFVSLKIDCDFSQCALQDAINTFIKETNRHPKRLIISSVYCQGDILEIIFKVFGGLSLPFERSYALPKDAWMLVDDQGGIFYSPGA